MRMAGAIVLALIVSVSGVLAGAWWAPFTVGLVIGVFVAHARFAIAAGAVVGLLAWVLPLGAIQIRFGLSPAAESLAAIMGFGRQGAIPLVLTCLVGLLLGLTGSWLGSAGRAILQPASSR
jgi:hypothetical protein